MVHTEPRGCLKMGPEWAKMSLVDVFYLSDMFWVASELLSASSETLSDFVQWNPVFWQSWGGNFEWLKMAFIHVRLNFAAL